MELTKWEIDKIGVGVGEMGIDHVGRYPQPEGEIGLALNKIITCEKKNNMGIKEYQNFTF